MKCVSYTRTLPWKNHQSELTIPTSTMDLREQISSGLHLPA